MNHHSLLLAGITVRTTLYGPLKTRTKYRHFNTKDIVFGATWLVTVFWVFFFLVLALNLHYPMRIFCCPISTILSVHTYNHSNRKEASSKKIIFFTKVLSGMHIFRIHSQNSKVSKFSLDSTQHLLTYGRTIRMDVIK